MIRALVLLLVAVLGIPACASIRPVGASLGEIAAAELERRAAEALADFPDPDPLTDAAVLEWLAGAGLSAEESALCLAALRSEGPCVLRGSLLSWLEDGALRRPLHAWGEGASPAQIARVLAARSLLAWARAERDCVPQLPPP